MGCSLSRRMLTIFHFFLGYFLLYSGLGYVRDIQSFGINYGQVANNLPPPDKVLELLRSIRITKTRIYDTNPQILKAFANTNVELVVTVENEMLATLKDQEEAIQWVSSRIRPYFPATKITGIAVGNEVYTGDDMNLVNNLVPAMVSIHAALLNLGLDQYIHVSSPCSLAVLEESYPPSAGSFKSQLNVIMPQVLQFLETTNSPFWINAYPYFAFKDNPNKISLDYVLFNRNQGMIDPYTKLHYDNMLYAQVDAVTFAIARMGFRNIEVKVSETGWPSKGDPSEIGATLQNAAIYNMNLLRRQLENEGTPVRPKLRLDVYLFALFNEDMKPGPTSERNFGLFQPDMSMAYNVGLSALAATSSTTPSSASIFLSSSATKENQTERQSLIYWTFVHLFLVTYSSLFSCLMRYLEFLAD